MSSEGFSSAKLELGQQVLEDPPRVGQESLIMEGWGWCGGLYTASQPSFDSPTAQTEPSNLQICLVLYLPLYRHSPSALGPFFTQVISRPGFRRQSSPPTHPCPKPSLPEPLKQPLCPHLQTAPVPSSARQPARVMALHRLPGPRVALCLSHHDCGCSRCHHMATVPLLLLLHQAHRHADQVFPTGTPEPSRIPIWLVV